MESLSEVTLEGLNSLGEHCRRLIEQAIVTRADRDFRIRVSIGRTLISPEDTPETRLRRVDRKLYQSKQRGRNCATVG